MIWLQSHMGTAAQAAASFFTILGNETFMMTYGDGVCDVDIRKLVEFHHSHGKIATLTAVLPEQQLGVFHHFV